MSKFGNFFKGALKGWFNPVAVVSSALKNFFNVDVGDAAGSWIKGKTGAGLTNAQIEQNQWSADEAQKAYERELEADSTKYQRQTADMMAAGLNPAVMYGNSISSAGSVSSTAASGSPASNVGSGMIDSILNVVFAKERMANLKSDSQMKRDQGEAALITARANAKQAENASRQAAVAEARVQIDRMLADKKLDVDQAYIENLAANAAYVTEQKNYISTHYEILEKNADSAAKQAMAALRQSDAAIQNAATQSYLGDYQAEVLSSQYLLNSVIEGEHKVLYDALPERVRLEVDNLRKQGLVLDEQGRLIHRQGNLATAETVKTYVSVATDVARTAASIATGGSVSSSSTPSYGYSVSNFF